jgi:dihydroorotate dehydrogenase
MATPAYRAIRLLLRAVSPETAHGIAIRALRAGLVAARPPHDDPILAIRLWDIDFPNPVGLAAGFDKNAEVMGPMLSLGFGFVEAGTVTPQPQSGNPRPRLFRLDEDEAVINRFGFNSQGLGPFVERLERWREHGRVGIVGANVGKNRDTQDGARDYVAGVEAVCAFADYLVCNVSSPNTPGLRSLQARAAISDLLGRVQAARQRHVSTAARMPPLLAKVGPDLDDAQLRDIAEVALSSGVDGLIVGNTTIARPPGLSSVHAGEMGGLSGKPLMAPSTRCLAQMYRLTGGRLPLIGCGGIASGADAYAKIRAGASLVQLYSALVFHGPMLVSAIKRGLAQRLHADGFHCVREAVGADHR